MRIYIDESGGFIPKDQPASKVSCVAALVVPELSAADLLADFVSLRSKWTARKEIKASELDDGQIEAVLWLLGRYEVVAEIATIDAGSHRSDEIRRLRAAQGDKIVASLTAQHHPNLRRQLEQLRDEWLRLSEQLVVQMFTMLVVIDSVIRNVTLYYAQRLPEELGRFDWIIDPKDIERTRYERVWEMVICPWLQDLSLRKPMKVLDVADYSAFSRFNSPITEPPDYLKQHLPYESGNERFQATDINKLMRESVRFPQSESEPGLQLVDIIANTLTRAMNKKLPQSVWRHLGGLTLQKARGRHSIHAIMLTADPAEPGAEIHETNFYGYVLRELDHYCKPMLANKFW